MLDYNKLKSDLDDFLKNVSKKDLVEWLKFDRRRSRKEFLTPVHFGRWLLKYAQPASDGQWLTWQWYNMETDKIEFKDTDELYEIYKKTVL